MHPPLATVSCADASEPVHPRIEQLQREIAERDDLLAIAAHELRNPLHALSLQLSLARTGVGSTDNTETTARITKAQAMLTRYSNRVTMLMELIRSNHANYPTSPQLVDVCTLLGGIAENLQQEARFRGAVLRTQLPPRCTARVDPLLLEQIVDNLLINAFKHAACSEVLLTLHAADGPALRIDVADNGRGIAPADQQRIFGKFSVAQASPRGTGTGLGLWIVRRLAAALGGTITLDSAPGRGSVFSLHLPLSAAIEA